jgi:hypothetical protein
MPSDGNCWKTKTQVRKVAGGVAAGQGIAADRTRPTGRLTPSYVSLHFRGTEAVVGLGIWRWVVG